jgi:WD40 repeat protein
VLDAFGRDLDRFDEPTRRRIVDLLMPLAYAQGRGLPQKTVWQQLASAIAGQPYSNADIRELKERADYYITRDVEGDQSVYRLFHEAFAAYVRDRSRDENVHDTIYRSLLAAVPKTDAGVRDWSQVTEPYVLNYLAVHASHAGHLGDLIADAGFLLYASPYTLASVLSTQAGTAPEARAYLDAYQHLHSRDAAERARYLALAATKHRCTGLLARLRDLPFAHNWYPAGAWYHVVGSYSLTSGRDFRRGCLVRSPDDTTTLIAIAGDRISTIDLSSGVESNAVSFAGGAIAVVAAVPSAGDLMVAAASADGHVSVVNVTQQRVHAKWSLGSGIDTVRLCGATRGTNSGVVTGTSLGSIAVWSIDGQQMATRQAHNAYIAFLGTGVLGDREVLISGSGAYEGGRIRERHQIALWDLETFDRLHEFRGPEGGDAEWAALCTVGERTCLVAYFMPSGYRLYDVETKRELGANADVAARPFGLAPLEGGSAVLSGFSNTFCVLRIEPLRDGRTALTLTADVRVEGGQWLGPTTVAHRSVAVSIGNAVRVWNLEGLMQKAVNAVKAEVGQVSDDGEPVFSLSSPERSHYFAGMSRYGNLRVWSGDGRQLTLHQVVTSLDASDDFDWIQMVDIDGRCLYVTAGKSGRIQVWDLNASAAFPSFSIGRQIDGFAAHVSSGRLLAVACTGAGKDYEVGVWDLVRREEVTSKGRFDNSYCSDKRIPLLAALDTSTTTMIAGALDHSFYHMVAAWDLSSEAYSRQIQQGYKVRHRRTEWQRTLSAQISSLSAVRAERVAGFAVGLTDGSIVLLDSCDGQDYAAYRPHDRAVVGIAAIHVGGDDMLVSAGREGRIIGATIPGEPLAAGSAAIDLAFAIDTHEQINAITALPDGRVVVGTELGFMMFDVSR